MARVIQSDHTSTSVGRDMDVTSSPLLHDELISPLPQGFQTSHIVFLLAPLKRTARSCPLVLRSH